MTKRLCTLAPWIAASLLFAGSVAAQASPTAFLKTNNEKLRDLVVRTQGKSDKISGLVGKMLDFDTLCRESLGKHWTGRSEAERKDFTDTLRALIEKNLVKSLKDSKENKISYESEQVAGTAATVVTMLASGDDPRAEKTEIAYKLEKRGGSWGVVDMITDGVSLVANYRSQFNKIITEQGWPALMQKMRDKLAENP